MAYALNKLSVLSVEDATTASSGSISTVGGIGAAKDVFVGGTILTSGIQEAVTNTGVTVTGASGTIDVLTVTNGSISIDIGTSTDALKAAITTTSILEISSSSVRMALIESIGNGVDLILRGRGAGSVQVEDALKTNSILERTNNSGVTIDSVLIKDNTVQANSISFDGVSSLAKYTSRSTFTPTPITSGSNLGGTASLVAATNEYFIIGDILHYGFSITGFTVTTAGLNTSFTFTLPVGLEMRAANQGCFGYGYVLHNASALRVPVNVQDNTGGNDNVIAVTFTPVDTGAVSISVSGWYFIT